MSYMIQRARRCQLITGTFKGNQHGCSCECPSDCVLTEKEREHYKKYPTVIETLEEQRARYNETINTARGV